MQQDEYILYGSEYSPFSVKVRSYFRYKEIDHEWRPRTLDNMAHFTEHAKLPLVPLIISKDGSTLQDSTPIMEAMEAEYRENSICPPTPETSFVSFMIEEYADEWVNKPMFHYRWWREVDQRHVATALAETLDPAGSEKKQMVLADQIRKRMVPRLSFVGSSAQNKEIIEASLDALLGFLERHLSQRAYLFGARPSYADFGLFGQLYGCTQQPTSLKIMQLHPEVMGWIDRMLFPLNEGDWESWSDLSGTLSPLLKSQLSGLYLPWAVANNMALLKENPEFTVKLGGTEFTQDTVKYAGRSFQVLKTRFAAIGDRGPLEELLLEADCMTSLITESW